MSEITTALSAATALFAVAVTLALLVTGFFIGRKWFRDAGFDNEVGRDYMFDGQMVGNMTESEAQAWRNAGHKEGEAAPDICYDES